MTGSRTLPETEQEWGNEIRGFRENYEFPCIGAWDGLKSYYSFKKRYTMTNMGLVGYNKRFLYAGIGTPGSTHDARLLRDTSIYQDIMNGGAIPQRSLFLVDFGARWGHFGSVSIPSFGVFF